MCPSPVWIQELTFRRKEILAKVNESFNQNICHDIKCVPGNFSEIGSNEKASSREKKSLSSMELNEDEYQWINNKFNSEISREIEDEELKLKLKALMEKDLKLKKKRKELGYVRCNNCKRQVLPEGHVKSGICAICYDYFTKRRMESIMNMLADVPWLSKEELGKYYKGLTALEYNRAKKRLKDITVDGVYRAYFAYLNTGKDKDLRWLKNSLNKYVLIASGKKPEEIDYKTWLNWVKSFNKNMYKNFLIKEE